jgi:hypothetical protein
MPNDQELSPGKKSAKTKGPLKLRKAGRRAADTRSIRTAVAQAGKHLADATAKLELVQRALERIDSSAKPGKRPPKRKPQSR